jgi:hypothetical protein
MKAEGLWYCTQWVNRVPTQGTVGRESILGTVHQSVTRNGVSTRAKRTAYKQQRNAQRRKIKSD